MEEIKKMLIQLMEGQEAIKIDINGMKSDISGIKNDIKKIDFKIEELDKKVDLSLEGHKSNTEQLNRIESEVSRQQEVILRKVQ
jgi:archaellum component FlaC